MKLTYRVFDYSHHCWLDVCSRVRTFRTGERSASEWKSSL